VTIGYHPRSTSYSLDEGTGVATLAHDDPKTLHALSLNLTTEVFMALEHAARDERVKVLIYTATGQRAFCSGAALKGAGPLHVPAHAADDYVQRGMMHDRSNPLATFWVPLIQALWDFPKPIVGAINGLGVRRPRAGCQESTWAAG
jgi:2-(1,2-epoxy-1,2-dihydrophenyl)acetyl-CoA isomerase